MNHSHTHAPADYGKAFAIGIVLNISFVVIEGFYGWRADSLALLADAGHNLSDVAGLMLAWAAVFAGQRPGNDRHTYGWRKGSILASFINAAVLLIAMGALGLEAVQRLQSPEPVQAGLMMIVAAIGVLVNAATAALFMRGSAKDLNIRGAFLHMAADALVSLGVVVAGALYWWQGWTWLDPVVSLGIAGVILIGTWSLFRQSLHLLFDGVPDDIDLIRVRGALLALPEVIAVHDLHVWAMATTDNALTAHLVVGGQADHDTILAAAEEHLHEHFEIRHVTLQLESTAYANGCELRTGGCAGR